MKQLVFHRFVLTLLVNFISLISFAQHIPFSGNTTPTYHECVAIFSEIDQKYDYARLTKIGTGDIGKPIHLFIINKEMEFSPEHFNPTKSVVFINNAIHPGEPDGVDACISFCNEVLNPANELHYLLDSLIFCIIPIYNVDGALIRNSYSRSNQNGPESYGFRGNAKNLDLNRDFIKADSKNAKAFTLAFRSCEPEIFIDTHVSNGADYPYTMTLITTQVNKLGERQGNYLRKQLEPFLFDAMAKSGFEMCPYVNHMGRTPDSGIADFIETPRFSTGYAALYQTLGFTTETHMLKPYASRVEATYHFIVNLSKYTYDHNNEIILLKKNALADFQKMKSYPINFSIDTTAIDYFDFKGYEAIIEPALIGNGERLRYDKNQTYQKKIKHYKTAISEKRISIQEYYIIPQAWTEVIERLKWNGVLMHELMKDTMLTVSCKMIGNLKTSNTAYESHFVHSKYSIREETCNVRFFEGDYIVPIRQRAMRYIIETLEPESNDSFFKWNFFDGVLQQKEWFSDYVFEEKAAEILNENPDLRSRFEKELETNEELKEHWMQLYWIYRNSPYFEESAFRYPVYSTSVRVK